MKIVEFDHADARAQVQLRRKDGDVVWVEMYALHGGSSVDDAAGSEVGDLTSADDEELRGLALGRRGLVRVSPKTDTNRTASNGRQTCLASQASRRVRLGDMRWVEINLCNSDVGRASLLRQVLHFQCRRNNAGQQLRLGFSQSERVGFVRFDRRWQDVVGQQFTLPNEKSVCHFIPPFCGLGP
ncbi:hypothetical protein [Aquincola sp. J276]|uniref:hypothetical protein n=1 Tax=Aquincola sp. J276 TaxID=2898432 RepID=UPI002150E881|nr:hypothetical protein [Aquincola sp. J276]MCR5867631.1 hypothetical protein [Aquincola sp. J276]